MPGNNKILVIGKPSSEAQEEFVRSLAGKVLSFSDGTRLPDGPFGAVLLLFPKEGFEGDLSIKWKAVCKYGSVRGVNSLAEQKRIGVPQVLSEIIGKYLKSVRKYITTACWLAAYVFKEKPRKKEIKARKKILHLVKNGRLSGVTIMVRNLLEGVDREVFEPSVCFLEGGPLADEFKNNGVEVAILNRRDYDINIIGILKNLMEESGTDILHAHGFKETIYGRFAAGMAGVPVKVVHFHGGIADEWKKLAPFGRLSLRFTDAIIALTGLMKDEMTGGFYGYRADPDKIAKIPNCVDTRVFFPKDREAAKKRLGVPDGVPVIGMNARLSKEKGHEVLFSALKHLKDDGRKFVCLLTGGGPLEGYLKEKAGEAGISGEVVFLGVRRDIPDIVPAFDVYVQPSVWGGESFSLSTVEAMACGVPAVASRIGGLPEVVEHGATGYLFTPGDAGELAGYLKTLLDNPGRAASMGRDARFKAERDFSRKNFENSIKLLYLNLLSKKNGIKI